eukprot:TRINITY_DN21090_c0_g1_i2.p1 TRINITY_DN21090_c0_g1~~TRINITY_DN21090_c0_g1_i2.p1  ORF type:complete len:385 (+),score=35.07 TRINITY_DN21090_c0_g1_i2:360-1514(+)
MSNLLDYYRQLGIHVDREQVIQRIQILYLDFLKHLVENKKIPEYKLTFHSEIEQFSLNILKSLTANQGQGAYTYARMIKIVSIVYGLIIVNRQITLRGIWYMLKPNIAAEQEQEIESVFSSMDDVSSAVQDVCALLQVPRHCLNIQQVGKGEFSGNLQVKRGPFQPWQDCLNNVQTIPGDVAAILRYKIKIQANYIIIVEKDTIFQRLVEDKFPHLLSSVLITAKGMPDISTRAFIWTLLQQQQQQNQNHKIIVLGLVDWNPHGVSILTNYKFGSTNFFESQIFKLPQLMWLGARWSQISCCNRYGMQGLTQKDKGLFQGLNLKLSSIKQQELCMQNDVDLWIQELKVMEQKEIKAELEALFDIDGISGFAPMLVNWILRQDYV